jgi:hypothetical protein
VLRSCIVEHEWAGAPPGTNHSDVTGMELQHVRFRERFAGVTNKPNWSINANTTRGVHVDGPLVAWVAPAEGGQRRTGDIPDGRW